MKRLLTTLLVLACSCSFALTRPSAVQVKDKRYLDIREFGAKCDGSSDDAAAINAAIASASALEIGAVLVPKDTIVKSTITLSANVVLTGPAFQHEPAVRITGDMTASNVPIITTSARSVGVSNLTMWASSGQLLQHVIKVSGSDYSNFRNLQIGGNFEIGLYVDGGSASQFNRYQDIRVVCNNSTATSTYGIWLEAYHTATQMDHCSVTNASRAFHFDQVDAMMVNQPTAENCDYGFYIEANTTKGCSITEPYFEGNTSGQDIYLETGAGRVFLNGGRTDVNRELAFTYDKNGQPFLDAGGLYSLYQQNGVDNLIDNPCGYLLGTGSTEFFLGWTTVSATVTRELTNTNGFRTAMSFKCAGAGTTCYGRYTIATDTKLDNRRVSVSGFYYLPAAHDVTPRIEITTLGGTVLGGLTPSVDNTWTPFTFSAATANASGPYYLYVYANKAGAVGTADDYLSVTGVQVVAGGSGYAPAIKEHNDWMFVSENTTTDWMIVKPQKWIGYAVIANGNSSVTVTYPPTFSPTKVYSISATNGTLADPIKATRGSGNVVFTASGTVGADTTVWFQVWGK